MKEQDYLQETLQNLDFAKHVVSPLMGNDYVHVGKVISVPRDFASAMNDICRGHRPEHRLDKEIDESCSFGVIMPDFCFVPLASSSSPAEENSQVTNETRNPTFSVEIKPKCGFLPTSSYIDPTRAIKYSVCHYCMLQKSKVKEGKYNRQSKYCPLDLFSREPRRVMHALECLVSDPQNNLRVFCNGKGIFTEELVQEAIQNNRVCCAEKYFEVTLKEMDGFNNCMMVGHKCGDCVTTDCHKSGDGVTMNCHKSEEGVTMKSGNSATRESEDEGGGGMTTEDHKCGQVGALTRKFLDIILDILISDSIKSKVSPVEANTPSATQICKESKYPESKINIQSNLNHLKFGFGGVLQHLLSVQKLDDMDVEGIYPLYQNIISHFKCNPGLRESLGVDGPYTLPLWKSVASRDSSTSGVSQNATNITSHNRAHSYLNSDLYDQNNLHHAVLKICKFTVANTAKDLSVMISFQEIPNKGSTAPTAETTTCSGNRFCYSIDLVDLDPKEFDRVLKYYKDSTSAVKNYLE